MSVQWLIDGAIQGSVLALGAGGVTLTYANLRFGHFAHGELVAAGGYLALATVGLLGGAVPALGAALGPTTVSGALLVGTLVAGAGVAALALLLERFVYRRLRARAAGISAVMASFGVSMALRALLESAFTSSPRYYSEELSIAIERGGVRATPDQLLVAATALALLLAVHLVLGHSRLGRSMRAAAENPALAAVTGIDVGRMAMASWIVVGLLAGVTGVAIGVLGQVRPAMGAELLLPFFTAAVLGGLGSLPGALVGGLLVGLAESWAVATAGSEWRGATAFVIFVAVLGLRPGGLFGRPA
ncbi:MAG: branched-chain amino acid ABC transporter permease [Proteobacteria bacterium]|nr:branched-chain amino acid ABC transporter permease [Pseudomonadota bacterium]